MAEGISYVSQVSLVFHVLDHGGVLAEESLGDNILWDLSAQTRVWVKITEVKNSEMDVGVVFDLGLYKSASMNSQALQGDG